MLQIQNKSSNPQKNYAEHTTVWFMGQEFKQNE